MTEHFVRVEKISHASSRSFDFDTGEALATSSSSVACATARVLVERGAKDSDTLVVVDDEGRVRYTGGIGWLRKRTISETATAGPRFVRWKPFEGIGEKADESPG